jgi:hypothetical protein
MFKSLGFKTLPLCLGVILAISLVNYLVLAWTEPSQAPPGGNVNAPINVGNTGQSKAGGLVLNTGGAAIGLIIDKGNVGIGVSSPSKKLEVSGDIKTTGDICTDLRGGICLSNCMREEKDMIGGMHYHKECLDLGGTLVYLPEGMLCKFVASSCPSGWVQHKSYSTTVKCCREDCSNPMYCRPVPYKCCSAQHNFTDASVETLQGPGHVCYITQGTCSYCMSGCGYYSCGGMPDCTATVSEIGCK